MILILPSSDLVAPVVSVADYEQAITVGSVVARSEEMPAVAGTSLHVLGSGFPPRLLSLPSLQGH